MAKKKLIVTEMDGSKKKNKSFKITPKMVKILIAAVLILAVVIFSVIKVVEWKNSYIGTVDDIKIYVTDVESQLKVVESEMTEDLETDVEKEAFWSVVNDDGSTNRQKALDEAVKRARLVAIKQIKAREEGFSLTRKEQKNVILQTDDQIDYYMSQYGYTDKTREEFVQLMQGMSYPEYKRQTIVNTEANKIDVFEKAKIKPTEEQMKAWYEKDKDKYDLYITRRIYISYMDSSDSTKDLSEEDLKKKKETVAEIEKKLSEGAKFEDVAKEYTENSSEKTNGGTYKFKKDSADKDFINEWIKTAEVNKYAKLEDKTDDKVKGVYFIIYESKTTYDTEDNEDARTIKDTIKNEIIDDEYKKVTEGWLADSKYEMKQNGNVIKSIKVAGQKLK